ncbi:MAG: hypothetical protein JWM65_1131 [Sphingomonas bacterium]|nr:hypothetical protein [Sphingomonas bacterium]
MKGSGFFARGVAMAALVAMPVTAFAEGKTDQARKAIAAAQAKIDAANTVGAAGDAPRFQHEAVAALQLARDELAHHDKDAAIRDAQHASQLADMALSASSRARLNDQQAATDAAQRQAAAANDRAADAQASAAAAQADAAAARNAPPVVIAAPAPPPPAPTTITTETTQTAAATTTTATKPAVKRRVVRRVVHHAARPSTTTRTKTTVTTATPN